MLVLEVQANADRQADAGVFSRDVIDLAMMDLTLPKLRNAHESHGHPHAQGRPLEKDQTPAVCTA